MALWDRKHFDHMTGADRALQVEVLGLFRTQVEGWRPLLNGAADWRDMVHTLKGSARGIGLFDLAEACERAETASVGGVDAALEAVRTELDAAMCELDRFAAEAA